MSAMPGPSFQDQIPGNHCFGCGPDNPRGLHLRSHWTGEREARCTFRPEPWHCAGPTKYLNGGIIATIIDCHAICTAIAWAYREAGRAIGEGERLWYATGSIDVSYRRPADIGREVTVDARVVESGPRKMALDCTVSSAGVVCAEASVVAVKVSDAW